MRYKNAQRGEDLSKDVVELRLGLVELAAVQGVETRAQGVKKRAQFVEERAQGAKERA